MWFIGGVIDLSNSWLECEQFLKGYQTYMRCRWETDPVYG